MDQCQAILKHLPIEVHALFEVAFTAAHPVGAPHAIGAADTQLLASSPGETTGRMQPVADSATE